MTYIEPIRLEPGDEVRCPQCRQWHPVEDPHSEGTPYTLDMLYWECAKGMYFAGSRGTRQSASNTATDVGEVRKRKATKKR